MNMDKVTRENIGMQFCSDWLKKQMLAMISEREKLEAEIAILKTKSPALGENNGPEWREISGSVSTLFTEMQAKQEQLEAEVAVLREALDHVGALIEESVIECRGDEDCDHCVAIHHIIAPALTQTRAPLLLEIVRAAEVVSASEPGQSLIYALMDLGSALKKYRESK